MRAVAIAKADSSPASDRELYTVLWRNTLREENPLLPDAPGSAWHVDLLGSGTETDTYLYLKYYADEHYRQQWLADFPEYIVPPHEDAPFHRDYLLPQADDERSSPGEERPM